VEELPAAIEVGFALMLTVVTGLETSGELPPHPVNSSTSGRQDMSATEKRFRQKQGPMRRLINISSCVLK
jgi:hypothetical protein